MTGAGLTFLSWARTGLISAVGAAPGTSGNALDATLPARLSMPVTLTVTGAAAGAYQAGVIGPGDVIGLDRDQVIRTDPVPGAVEIEANYFAMIEFDRPDLPWMLTPTTPARAGIGDTDPRRGLRPWLCLVVIPDRAINPPTALIPLPRVNVSDRELPDLESSWLWAHAQVVTAAGDDLQAVVRTRPERTLSRLIAPRRLRPGITYLACVVPTFEAGRRAGIGKKAPESGPLAPAWTHAAEPRDVELPIYYSWRFTTSKTLGDFEQLARRLQAKRFGVSGVRPLDIGGAGSGLPGPAAGQPPWRIPLEGVIVGDQIVQGEWTGASRAPMPPAIALRLSSSDQELAPPTYGSLQGGYPGSLTGGQGPLWLRDLNLDPRYRATAALGTRIVQRHQEALVASAWEQTAEMREANRRLRQAQLARAVGTVIESRLADPAQVGADRLLQVTQGIHSQLRAPSGVASIATSTSRNTAVAAAVSMPFRRIARPSGPVARRVSPARMPAPVVRLGLPAANAQALRPTPRLRAVGGTLNLGQVSAAGTTESLATLTATRVGVPVFTWEGAAGLPNLPHAYLSDLVFTVFAQRGQSWEQVKSSVAVARALDFDGTPQLGWESLSTGAGSLSNMSASVFVERAQHRGVLEINLSTYYANRNVFYGTVYWRSGFALGSGMAIAAPTPGSVVHGEIPAGLSIVAADLAGNGRIDAVVLWADSTTVPLGPGISGPGTLRRLAVGLDFDPVTGAFRGGWTSPRDIGSAFTSVAAVGSQLFVLDGKRLRVLQLATTPAGGATTLNLNETGSVDLGGQLPEDFQGASAVAAADFGGGTGVDLLVCFVAGSGASARAAYRIAYDVRPDGTIGRWSETHAVPTTVEGRSIAVVLGPTSQATLDRRTALGAAFRAAAAATQTRQERIVPASAPPPPAPAVDGQQLATAVRAGIDQAAAVEASVFARLALATPVSSSAVRDPLQPLALTPRFPFPTFELLRDEFHDRVYPGASALPDDCVTVLVPNRRAIEAFLVGLNHEMSRELLWRGFPVRHGTFFAQFWDAARQEIAPIEGWSAAGALGTHAPNSLSQQTLLLVVRAELLRRIPHVTIYAAPAKPGQVNGRTVDLDPSRRRDPLFSGRLNPDIRFFAFNLTAAAARGAGATDGWYFVFQQHPTAPRFGLDEGDSGFGTRPAHWGDLAWPHVVVTAQEAGALVHLDADRASTLAGLTLPDTDTSPMQHRWGFSAAHMAHITLQRPVQIAIHGSDLIAPGITV